jgi:hypothetical protein
MRIMVGSTDVLDEIEAATAYYEKSAPVVEQYLDELYRRLGENCDEVVVSEIVLVGCLREEGTWMHPNTAANRVYKLLDRLGRSTVGMAGF